MNGSLARILLILSKLLFAAGLFTLIFWNPVFGKKKKLSLEKRGIILIIFTVAATFLMRYFVGLSGGVIEDFDNVQKASESGISWNDEIANSFLHSMQSFSMDEDYTGYLKSGAYYFSKLNIGDGPVSLALFTAFTCILNVMCALLGGAIIITVLSKIFPGLRFALARMQFTRKVVYFNELNEESFAMARSLSTGSRRERKSLIIFSNVDLQQTDATRELAESAKLLGAVLVESDFSELPIMHRRGKTFFLMNKDDGRNLAALACFMDEKRYSRLTDEDRIYIYYEESGSSLAEANVRSFLNEKLENEAPLVFGVNKYKNLVYDLLVDKPLFTALEPKPLGKARDEASNAENDDLELVILGSGRIGMELFLASYWCGQLLDRELHITVISKEEEQVFEDRLNHINSDILRTAVDSDDLLKIYPEYNAGRKQFAEVYLRYRYISKDVNQCDMLNVLNTEKCCENSRPLIDADYFVVALGSDEENSETAELLRRFITTREGALAKRRKERGVSVPIACAIYNDAISSTVSYSPEDGTGFAAEIIPFGSLGELYDYAKILREKISERADSTDKAYQKLIAKTRLGGGDAEFRDTLARNIYNYWSSITRAIHSQYKAFCLDGMSVEDYLDRIGSGDKAISNDPDLAWLEHRRWNAYMRSEGFKSTEPTNPKSIALKLHPCIVESDRNKKTKWSKSDAADECDMLDLFSSAAGYDIKQYDFPSMELDQ